MSWVALVGPEIEENLSLRYLAAALEAAGFRTEILPLHEDHHFAAAIQQIVGTEDPPLLVGLSMAFQWRVHDATALAVALRRHGYAGHLTAGGHFATFAAMELLRDFPELDTVCRHEAEPTICALARGLHEGVGIDGITGLARRDETGEPTLTALPAVPDLASLPWPDRRGPPASCFGQHLAPLVASRGCYANCTFCCIAAWHEQTLPGKRYRLRDPDDVAAEMVQMQRERDIRVFVFHDDNFFLPSRKASRERFEALADALEARQMGHFATVVKARPTDVRRDVFEVLKERLNCIRIYIGIETDADQGLQTLRRWSSSEKNHQAIDVVRDLELYTCFNMLIFDPDTTIESLNTNIDFMEWAPEYPSNFGRVELYAGTPLLARMQAEGRCRGDYMSWDYDLSSPRVQRVFELAMAVFRPRNFSAEALANQIMGTRFDIEVARHFHAERYDPRWLEEGKQLTRELTLDSVRILRAILAHTGSAPGGDCTLVEQLASEARATERDIWGRCMALARRMAEHVGCGIPLTRLGDVTATPLQRAVAEVGP